MSKIKIPFFGNSILIIHPTKGNAAMSGKYSSIIGSKDPLLKGHFNKST
jgi:hypothetical protein